jgi:hypothetical protein
MEYGLTATTVFWLFGPMVLIIILSIVNYALNNGGSK